MLVTLARRLFLVPWERLNQEAADERARHPGFDVRVAWTLVLAALVLVFQEYYGDRPAFDTYLGARLDGWHWYALGGYAWWAGAKLVGYLVVPALVLWLSGARLGDYGLGVRGMRRHVWIYVALYLGVLPLVIAASYTHAFQTTYPFYRMAARSWTDLIAWEAMYGASFLALEFFFRGFLLVSLRRSMGAYAIFVMAVPYCMIHFHKPVAEVVGAIFAGIVLGTLAMVTRSIWCGVLIHVSVAWTMDLLAILHTTGLPSASTAGQFTG